MDPTLGILTTIGNYLLLKAQRSLLFAISSPLPSKYALSVSGHGIITDRRLKQPRYKSVHQASSILNGFIKHICDTLKWLHVHACTSLV
jgi:hypothetical protein